MPASPILHATHCSSGPFNPVTARSLTIHLAYIQYYTPKRSPRGLQLAPGHLRRLASWIDQPAPRLRRLQDHRPLAAQFALLHAGNLLTITPSIFRPGQTAGRWLSGSPQEQLEPLRALLDDEEVWAESLAVLNLESAITLDYLAYLRQTLDRQLSAPAPVDQPAAWLSTADDDPDYWRLRLPTDLPASLLFDLLQLGEWQPTQHQLLLTPLSLASFPACTYGPDRIRWLLEMATHKPLCPTRQDQLQAWLRRADAYRLHGGLLTTSQPHHLQALLSNRRLRRWVHETLGPRHALVDPGIAPALRRWLARQGFPLNQPASLPDVSAVQPGDDLAACWLGLRLLVGLQKRLPLSVPAPTAQLFQLSQAMPPEMQDQLEQQARAILQALDDTDHGRDAFFPARQCPSPAFLACLKQAIAEERPVTFWYQGLGQPEPQRHTCEPHWLEERQKLIYLHAYNYRAEALRVYRLDRVIKFEDPLPQTTIVPGSDLARS